MPRYKTVREVLAGRWELPAAGISVLALAVGLYFARPAGLPSDLNVLIADVVMLANQGALTDASDAAANLLSMDPPLPEFERAQLHEVLAAAVFERQARLKNHTPHNLQIILNHQEEALQLGLPETADARFRLATVNDWLDRVGMAIRNYERVLQLEPRPEVRRKAWRRLVELQYNIPSAADQRREHLYSLLEDSTEVPEYLWWGMRTAIGEALDEGKTQLARMLLERFGEPLRADDLGGYHEFLDAWILLNEGKLEEAGPLVDWVEEWLIEVPPVAERLDPHGNLAALNQWLLGRLELEDDRPQTALEAFETALALDPGTELQVAAKVARGEALAALQRHHAAVDSLSAVGRFIARQPAHARRTLADLDDALVNLFEERYALGDILVAAGYLDLAVQLSDDAEPQEALDRRSTLGQLYREVAASESDRDRRMRIERDAAEHLMKAAELALELDVDFRRQLLWDASLASDAGGRLDLVEKSLDKFVASAGTDPRLAEALLRLGRVHQVRGDFDGAIAAFRELIRTFPDLGEAVEARVALADCLAEKREQVPDALAALDKVLSGSRVNPEAPLFAQAWLRRAELLARDRRFGEAISELERYVEFYPQAASDPEVLYRLAQAYQGSGRSLLPPISGSQVPGTQVPGTQASGTQAPGTDSATADANAQPAGAEAAPKIDPALARERFGIAADYYAAYLQTVPEELDTLSAQGRYTRVALLNRGHCLLQTGRENALDDALSAYQQAAAQFEQSPTTLHAFTQIANIHLRQGRVEAARRAIERARWLLPNIPDIAFTDSTGAMSRAGWKSFLDTLASAEMFSDA